ncbi:MAG: hypothetical protein HY518_01040, partial [Candidatus Aenigmarchaeota archaeon]|nr:hypothetical protein [Candidatus Aenigmarchaeota archaeon]
MRFYLAVLLAFLVPFLLPVAIQAQQYQVGVSPSVIDIGDVSPGDSKVVKFYIVTASDIDLLVNLESQKGGIDFFVRDDYRDLIGEYSEQDASGWLNFVENPVELIPGEGQVKTKGGFITGWREVSFILNVPEYAEPGYHTITISPKPAASGGLGEQQVNIVAIVTTTVLFRVEGDATRNVEIL